MAGQFLQSLRQVADALGIGWRCHHCNQLSNEYTGNIIDGTSRCPNCYGGLDPNPFVGEYSYACAQSLVKLDTVPFHAKSCVTITVIIIKCAHSQTLMNIL